MSIMTTSFSEMYVPDILVFSYQKFTKGKDLSAASAVDMDCIFGRRKSKSASNTPQCQSEVGICNLLVILW